MARPSARLPVVTAVAEGTLVTLSTHAFGEEWTLEYVDDSTNHRAEERLRLEKSITLLTETLRRNR